MLKLASLFGSSLILFGCAASRPTPENVREVAEKPAAKPATKKKGPAADRLSAAHVLIAYKGAQRAKPTVTRSKTEALALATKLATQLGALDVGSEATTAKFAEAARKHSDCPSAARGGNLGIWRRGRMAPAFDQATLELNYGEVSPAVETPFGFHVIRRKQPPIDYAASQILIAYKGAKRSVVRRSRAEALALATTIVKQLRADPTQFVRSAQVNSDGPSGPRGGKLGILPKGMMPATFDAALAKLKIGEISDPVETDFGFHVILREKP